MALILSPDIRIVAGSDLTLLVTTSDTDLANWTAAVATFRADPNYARLAPIPDSEDVDLSNWTNVLEVTGAFTGLTATTYRIVLTRAQTALLPVGRRRCVLDVWRTDTGDTYADVKPTWVDVVSPVYPLP